MARRGQVNPEPRYEHDYTPRQVAAARRVLIDIGQVLASFRDSVVIVGGWVPDLLVPEAEPEHVGSIDLDLALDAVKLGEGRYAELLDQLLITGRYKKGEKDFQLVADVDLEDGESPVRVDVEFLAPSDVKLKKNRPKLIEGFRVLQFPACSVAFERSRDVSIEGVMISGAVNKVSVRVVSLADFIIMKAHALEGRDKPKDVYDLCFCLDHHPDGIAAVADNWRSRRGDRLVDTAVRILSEKFQTVNHYGPQQLGVFHDSADPEERAMHARRGFELVQKLLNLL